ncbi:hypothetical protein SAMN03097699_0198 [Flavobacteriaceae bacterium MAR_2010_188]|nr:hypothetical protein SAMN03097699_0198 [Flavobacteriaceae bacterium MAR_2010_188]
MAYSYKAKSIRTFIGSKDYKESRKFYKDLGFEEVVLFKDMVVFKVNEDLCFYLQDAYVKDWINNSMVFLEVEDVDECYKDILARNLTEKYKSVRITDVKNLAWGREFFVHDPSGVLWHFGQFK